MSLDRIAQLEKLLRPMSTNGQRCTRKTYYNRRRREVLLAYPFMNEEERASADAWLKFWEYIE